MSSIRLFVLSSFAELGPMHGHRLRVEAERNHVHLWTDISVGAVYGAMKRLAAEGLLRPTAREQQGNRPTRQLYEITDTGRDVLAELRREGLSDVWFKYDPFDLALTRVDAPSIDALPAILAERLRQVETLLDETRRTNARARAFVGLAKQWALRHTEYRLEAEIAYLTDLLAAAPDIAVDERRAHLDRPQDC
jgi:DNA-binding PadR family transcriptional regulator